MKAKIITLAQSQKKLQPFKNKKKVLVGGCFDIIHIGHIRYLEAAKKSGDVVVVALEGDEFIQQRKKRKPFHTQSERAEILAALASVDVVILLPFISTYEEYLDLVKRVNPNIIAVTQGDTQLDHKKEQARVIKGRVKIVISKKRNTSSTDMLSHFT